MAAERKVLYLRLHPELIDKVAAEAKRRKISSNKLAEEILTDLAAVQFQPDYETSRPPSRETR